MKSYRILAGVFYVVGLGSLWIGWEGVVHASCQEVIYDPATCRRAWAGPPIENGSGDYCEWVDNNCQAAPDTDCVDDWGIAYEGECEYQAIGTSDPYECHQDAYLTVIEVPKFYAECQQDNGDCNCEWEEVSMMMTTVQLCDCYDQ